jgi:SAM-dependent methyltransferase
MEWLCRDMDLRPGMRVLDMGCGMAMSSVFLAREYGVQVWANDLWIPATDNWKRIEEQGLGDRVFPIHAEANALPYAHDFFDAIVSVDAYHYFGLADGYLDRFSRFVRPGGRIGVAVPGRMVEIPDEPVPAHLQDWLAGEVGAFETWQSVEFWRRRFSSSPGIKVLLADSLPDGWRDWVSFSEMTLAAGEVRPPGLVNLARKEVEAIREDAGRVMGFVRVVAERSEGNG